MVGKGKGKVTQFELCDSRGSVRKDETNHVCSSDTATILCMKIKCFKKCVTFWHRV